MTNGHRGSVAARPTLTQDELIAELELQRESFLAAEQAHQMDVEIARTTLHRREELLIDTVDKRVAIESLLGNLKGKPAGDREETRGA